MLLLEGTLVAVRNAQLAVSIVDQLGKLRVCDVRDQTLGLATVHLHGALQLHGHGRAVPAHNRAGTAREVKGVVLRDRDRQVAIHNLVQIHRADSARVSIAHDDAVLPCVGRRAHLQDGRLLRFIVLQGLPVVRHARRRDLSPLQTHVLQLGRIFLPHQTVRIDGHAFDLGGLGRIRLQLEFSFLVAAVLPRAAVGSWEGLPLEIRAARTITSDVFDHRDVSDLVVIRGLEIQRPLRRGSALLVVVQPELVFAIRLRVHVLTIEVHVAAIELDGAAFLLGQAGQRAQVAVTRNWQPVDGDRASAVAAVVPDHQILFHGERSALTTHAETVRLGIAEFGCGIAKQLLIDGHRTGAEVVLVVRTQVDRLAQLDRRFLLRVAGVARLLARRPRQVEALAGAHRGVALRKRLAKRAVRTCRERVQGARLTLLQLYRALQRVIRVRLLVRIIRLAGVFDIEFTPQHGREVLRGAVHSLRQLHRRRAELGRPLHRAVNDPVVPDSAGHLTGALFLIVFEGEFIRDVALSDGEGFLLVLGIGQGAAPRRLVAVEDPIISQPVRLRPEAENVSGLAGVIERADNAGVARFVYWNFLLIATGALERLVVEFGGGRCR